MAEGDKLSIGDTRPEPVSNMPFISGTDGETMAPEDLKEGDILVVYWVEPTKYKAQVSIVRFERLGPGEVSDARRVIFLSRAESEPLGARFYPLADISEMRLCAHDSSASSQIFGKLHDLFEENNRLWGRLERIKERFLGLLA